MTRRFQKSTDGDGFSSQERVNRRTNDEGKAFPSSLLNAFWSDDMFLLKSKLSNIR